MRNVIAVAKSCPVHSKQLLPSKFKAPFTSADLLHIFWGDINSSATSTWCYRRNVEGIDKRFPCVYIQHGSAASSLCFKSLGTGCKLSVLTPPLSPSSVLSLSYPFAICQLAKYRLVFRLLLFYFYFSSFIFLFFFLFSLVHCSCHSVLSWSVPHPDTAEGVAQELVSAGLISGQDLVVGKTYSRIFARLSLLPFRAYRCLWSVQHFLYLLFPVAANLSKVIDNPPSSKSMTFPLVSIACVLLFVCDFSFVWEACWVVRCTPIREWRLQALTRLARSVVFLIKALLSQ